MVSFVDSGGEESPPRLSLEDDPRQDALGRLVVRLLEDIISDEKDALRSRPGMSRDAARGIIAIVKEAIGDYALADYQALCRRVLARLSRGRRMPRWDAFYDDESSREIRQSALIKLAVHLDQRGSDAACSRTGFPIKPETEGKE